MVRFHALMQSSRRERTCIWNYDWPS